MVRISTYVWVKFMVNVGKYTLHGSYGFVIFPQQKHQQVVTSLKSLSFRMQQWRSYLPSPVESVLKISCQVAGPPKH